MDRDPPSDPLEPNTPLDGFLTRREICRKLEITSKTLTRWMSKGEFPRPIRMGNGQWERWLVEQVDQWRQGLVDQIRGGGSKH